MCGLPYYKETRRVAGGVVGNRRFMKTYKKYSTLQVARLLGVSDQSVANWIDAGKLRAGRTPGGHRRVESDDLVAFLRLQGLRIPSELRTSAPSILLVTNPSDGKDNFAATLQAKLPQYRVLTAHDGFVAGQATTSELPDLVIVDLETANINPLAICRAIKSRPQTQHIRVIAISAQIPHESEGALIDAGAASVLRKPLNETEFVKTVMNSMPSC